jgi:predicted type IV restriction endonuclease
MTYLSKIRCILENFIDELNSNIDTHKLELLLKGDDILRETDLKSKPEAWTKKFLIRKLLDEVELEWKPEIHGKGEGYPDFGITNLEVKVIGEDKSINKIEEAKTQVQDYLNNRAASRGAEYGIATDGIEWIVLRIELGGDYLDYSEIGKINFRPVLKQIAYDRKYIRP